MTAKEELELIKLLEEECRHNARKSHLDFMEYCWQKGATEPFTPGFHTEQICKRIDKAFVDFKNGKSTYLKISVHHRAGKSDLLSRYLPPHFLGEFPECEVLSTTYQSGLTQKFTSFARNVFRSEKYGELYPDLELSQESNAKAYWEIVDKKTGRPTQGKLFGSGISSGITGSGGHLVLLDDPISGRADAESKVIRDKVWDAITNDLMTRLAPVHIMIILATQWHVDDPQGRIDREMKSNPDFPRFETLRFPARSTDYTGTGKYPGKYLFLERYSETWYKTQRATLGKYGAAALLDCDPHMRSGGRFNLDNIDYHSLPFDHLGKRWARIWDLAHSAKQRSGDDPDYTSGTLLAFEMRNGDPVPHLWIEDVVRCREDAPERDRIIKSTARRDGQYVKQAIETSLDSKDAYQYITKAIPEISWSEIKLHGKGDKSTRATPLEPIFEAPGHVHVRRGEWNDEWITELMSFDGTDSGHDDQVDNLSAGYIFLVGGSSENIMDDEIRQQMADMRRR